MTLQTQVLTMVAMICSGIYLGMAKETYQRFTSWWQHRAILSLIIEVLFWISQTCLLFYVLYNVNYGELRVYVFLACALGFCMYSLLLKKLYCVLLEWMIKVVNFLVITPILFIFSLVFVTLKTLVQIALFIIRWGVKVIVFPFKLLKRVIKLIIPKKVYIKVSQLGTFCSTILTNYKKSD